MLDRDQLWIFGYSHFSLTSRHAIIKTTYNINLFILFHTAILVAFTWVLFEYTICPWQRFSHNVLLTMTTRFRAQTQHTSISKCSMTFNRNFQCFRRSHLARYIRMNSKCSIVLCFGQFVYILYDGSGGVMYPVNNARTLLISKWNTLVWWATIRTKRSWVCRSWPIWNLVETKSKYCTVFWLKTIESTKRHSQKTQIYAMRRKLTSTWCWFWSLWWILNEREVTSNNTIISQLSLIRKTDNFHQKNI